jgi:hypothetical protein
MLRLQFQSKAKRFVMMLMLANSLARRPIVVA